MGILSVATNEFWFEVWEAETVSLCGSINGAQVGTRRCFRRLGPIYRHATLGLGLSAGIRLTDNSCGRPKPQRMGVDDMEATRYCVT
jgi:hypothetical protein